MNHLSRRSALGSLVVSPLVVTSTPAASIRSDTVLLELGRRFAAMATKLDNDIDVSWEMLEEFNEVEAQIIATAATTLEGLSVKARVTCWALLGDLDPNEQSTTNERMALSIIRDLIRLCDPDLERPGALKRLVREIEQTAEARRQRQG
jgi:hypothetical protein